LLHSFIPFLTLFLLLLFAHLKISSPCLI
jgi:hypothetical protein